MIGYVLAFCILVLMLGAPGSTELWVGTIMLLSMAVTFGYLFFKEEDEDETEFRGTN